MTLNVEVIVQLLTYVIIYSLSSLSVVFSITYVLNSPIYSENPAQSAKAALGDLPNAGVFKFRITEQIFSRSREISSQHWQILDLKIILIGALNDDKEKKSINKRTPNLQSVKGTTLSNL